MARIKIQDLSSGTKLNRHEMRVVMGGVTSFQAAVVNALTNCVDQKNMDLLNQIINAANEVSNMDDVSNITFDSNPYTRRKLPDD